MALTNKLTAIADAIREKTGGSDPLTLDQMPTEIASIETGGGGVVPFKYGGYNAELFDSFERRITMADTSFASWTPSTTRGTLLAQVSNAYTSKSFVRGTDSFIVAQYITVTPTYSDNAPAKSRMLSYCSFSVAGSEFYRYMPSSSAAGLSSITGGYIRYLNSSGVDTATQMNTGIYATCVSAQLPTTTTSSGTVRINQPPVYAVSSSAYMSNEAFACIVDFEVKWECEIYRVPGCSIGRFESYKGMWERLGLSGELV